MYAGDEFYDDDVTSGIKDDRCEACDEPLTDSDQAGVPERSRGVSVRRALTAGQFEAKLCECGHTYGRHPWYDNPRGVRSYGWCIDCACRRRVDAEAQAEARARAAIAADPTHVHGLTHTAYACPGFRPFEVCDECGSWVTQP